MPSSAITASSVPRRPSRPPCTLGCRVLTRPSMISGKPVSSLTSRTGTPTSRSALALPPVERISMPSACRARPISARSVLSETLSSARRAVMMPDPVMEVRDSLWSDDAEFAQLLAQRGAMDAQHAGRATLVAVAPREHFAQQRRFHFAQQAHVQPFAAGRAIQVGKVAAHAGGHALAERRIADAWRFSLGGWVGMQGAGIHDRRELGRGARATR